MKRMVLGLLVCLCVCAPAFEVAADDGYDFKIGWVMLFPRSTYFIGETITFRVEAYAEIQPDLKIPDQYANIVVRNESMFEVFNYWIYTDANGSAWVNWTTQLDYTNGTYLVTLTDGLGGVASTQLTLLWDQNIAWQRQIDDLATENEYLWGYVDELFGARNYLLRKTEALTHAIYFLAFGFALTFCAAIWVWAREYIRVNARLPREKRSGIASTLGFRAQPFFLQTYDHPEAANYQVPEHHKAPRFGEEYHCPLCDKDAKKPMTKHQWEGHMQDFHDRKLIGFRAWVKKRRFKEDLARLYGKDDVPVIIEALKAENIRRERLMKRTQELRAKIEAGELSDAEAESRLAQLRSELGLTEPVLKELPLQKHESTQKPPEEIPVFRVVSKPVQTAPQKSVRTRKVKVY